MPKEDSLRLKLKNPSTGEFDWDKSWWENTAILDKHPGIKVVTSSTLPEEPWLGQFVFNVDTHSLLVWNGYNWVDQSSGMFDYVQAGEDIEAGKVVYIDKDGRIYCASNNLPKDYYLRVLGVSINEIKTNEFGLIKRNGLIKNPNWNLEAGHIYYLGLNGNITDKKPKKKLLISVGVAFSFDSLSIRILDIKLK